MNENNKENRDDYLGDELFSILARFLNSPKNRHFMDSIRGEYGVLWYLLKIATPVTAGELKEALQVVPGRMTDILTSLEKKGLIVRCKDIKDRRIVNVSLTPEGRTEALKRRISIHEEYEGLFDLLSQDEARELIRLLRILLTYGEE